MKTHMKRYWKRYLTVAVIAAALYYGVPPETAQAALAKLLAVFGL